MGGSFMKKGMWVLLGVMCLLTMSLVSANDLQVDANTPLIIKASCSGEDASANIMIYSGTSMISDNLVKERTDMIKLSPSDFVYTYSFSSVGVYTAFEECVFGGGFTTQQVSTITVTDFVNLITSTNLTGYNYEADLYYDVYFKSDPTKDKTIKLNSGMSNIYFQPKELNIINSLDTKKQTIKSVQRGNVSVENNILSYNNVYGNGLSLQYLINSKYVKEDLLISNASVLPVAHSDLVNPLLELNFLMTITDRNFLVDGALWDIEHVAKISTSNKVIITDDAGATIYVMEVPVAYDSNGAYITGTYSFERDGADKVKVAVKMPYAWFKDSARVFPIMVDPTLDAPDGTSYFGSSTPVIVVDNFTIPAGVPFKINQSVMMGDVPIMDVECELDITDVDTGVKVVDYRSFFNDGNGDLSFVWGQPNTESNPYVGNFTGSEYCWRGDTLVLNKIYQIFSVIVY